MTEAWIAARFIHFAAAMAVFGLGAFRVYAFVGGAGAAKTPARIALDQTLAGMTAMAAVLALLSAVAIIPFIAAEMAGSNEAALDPAVWQTVLGGTGFGHAWCWHLGFAVVLVGLSFIPATQRRAHAPMIAALLLLVSLGWVGHAAVDMGGGITHVINQMAHLIGGGLWLGGLVPLCVLLWRATRPGADAYVALARVALPHFSQIGYAAVALILVTGTVNSVLLVGSLHAFIATPYGRLLIVKIALVLTMIGLALVNRFRLLPRLRTDESGLVPLRTLLHSVIAEQALGIAILAVVAVLGTWPPAISDMGGMQM
jgi:copper resistance protein D